MTDTDPVKNKGDKSVLCHSLKPKWKNHIKIQGCIFFCFCLGGGAKIWLNSMFWEKNNWKWWKKGGKCISFPQLVKSMHIFPLFSSLSIIFSPNILFGHILHPWFFIWFFHLGLREWQRADLSPLFFTGSVSVIQLELIYVNELSFYWYSI